MRRALRTLLASLALSAVGVVGSSASAQPSAELKESCAGCHALTRPEASVERLWTRKGPDLWYAGDKFNRDWLVQWLQKPAAIRPGGVQWFNFAKPGNPRDTLDLASVPKHPSVDAAKANKLADALLQLRSDGLVTAGAYKAEGANPSMGKLAFGKLRGCVACHSDKPGEGGVSGPHLYDAGQRLKPDYIHAYTKDPQKFDRFVWMPNLGLSDQDLQRITAYVSSLGGAKP